MTGTIDFFIVGAPKCGTTALYTYLGRHPGICVPEGMLQYPGKREPCHFATDLLREDDPFRSRDYFMSFFPETDSDRIYGDASVYHLYSKTAARNILEFNREAKVIIMLRNPLEVLASLHAQMVWNGREPLATIAEALAAEPRRKRGVDVPTGLRFVEMLYYRDIVRYGEQVQRYFNLYQPKQVHVIIFDDFKNDPKCEFERTLRFLGVDTLIPDTALEIVNPSKRVRYRSLHRWAQRRPSVLRTGAQQLLPRPLRIRLHDILFRLNAVFNTSFAEPQAVSGDLEEALKADLMPEIECLGSLLGRDLTHWVK